MSEPLPEPPEGHNAWWHLARAEQLLEQAAREPASPAVVEFLVLRAHAHRELARTIQEVFIMQPAPPSTVHVHGNLGGQGSSNAGAGGSGGGGLGGGQGGAGGYGGSWRPA